MTPVRQIKNTAAAFARPPSVRESPKGIFPSPVKRDRGRGIETFGAQARLQRLHALRYPRKRGARATIGRMLSRSQRLLDVFRKQVQVVVVHR